MSNDTAARTDAYPEIEILKGDPLALAVFGHWMETGDAATIKDIAQRIGKSDSAVRRMMAKSGHCPDGCSVTDRSRSHDRRVDAWKPEDRTMRAVVKALRMHCGTLHREMHPERYLEGRDAAETHSN